MTKGDSQFSQKHQVVVINNFEYIINGLERNTEYSILIQCFNKKGAGPTSDPVVFKTFVNGKFLNAKLNFSESIHTLTTLITQ